MWLCVYLNWAGEWNCCIVSGLDFRSAIDSQNIFVFYFHSNFAIRRVLLVNLEVVFGFSVSEIAIAIAIAIEIAVRVLAHVPGRLTMFSAGVDVVRSSKRRGKMWR